MLQGTSLPGGKIFHKGNFFLPGQGEKSPSDSVTLQDIFFRM